MPSGIAKCIQNVFQINVGEFLHHNVDTLVWLDEIYKYHES